jgi:DNA-binding transcriptional LysR family regulator
VQLAAIRAGFGIGVCQTIIVRGDPDLVHLFPDEFAPSLEVWIAMHEDLKASAPMRAVFDHLAGALSRYAGARGTVRR